MNHWTVNWNSAAAILTSLFGRDVSPQMLGDGVAATSRYLADVAIESGGVSMAAGRLLDELAPVWNVSPADLNGFFGTAAQQKRARHKGKKIIMYQGTSDFLVPCSGRIRQRAEFLARRAARSLRPTSQFGTSLLHRGLQHGFYNTHSLLKRLTERLASMFGICCRARHDLFSIPGNSR